MDLKFAVFGNRRLNGFMNSCILIFRAFVVWIYADVTIGKDICIRKCIFDARINR